MEDVARLVREREGPPAGSDEDLAVAARVDRDAFGLLYERHRLPVYRYLRARVGSDDAAAELTAVTFERALGAIGRYRTRGGGLLAWLLRIARNAAIDDARRRSPRPLEYALAVPGESDPAAAVVVAERHAVLRSAVAALPEPQREAVLLRYASRLTAREIGEVIGRSEAATQKLLSRALATLRETHRDDL